MKVGDTVTVNKNYIEGDASRFVNKVGIITRIDDLPYPVQVRFADDTWPDQFDLEELDLYTIEPPC